MHKLIFVCLAVCTAALAFAERVSTGLFDFILSVVPIDPRLALAGGFDDTPAPTGAALDRSLQNGLRHEANVSRRSAARNT